MASSCSSSDGSSNYRSNSTNSMRPKLVLWLLANGQDAVVWLNCTVYDLELADEEDADGGSRSGSTDGKGLDILGPGAASRTCCYWTHDDVCKMVASYTL